MISKVFFQILYFSSFKETNSKWKVTFNWNTLSLADCATISNGEIGFCYCNTCSENEGDCDSHYECQDGLFCGSNNCPASLGFDSEIDCCTSTQIMSPNYPNSYPNNAEETWLITAPTGSIITLQFHSFHVRLIVESKNRTTVNHWTVYESIPKKMLHCSKIHYSRLLFSVY